MGNQRDYYRPHAALSSVGQSMMAGIPYVSSSLTIPDSGDSPLLIQFPYWTKSLTIKNTLSSSDTSSPIRFGFSSNGVQSVDPTLQNWVQLDNGESYTGEWRVYQVYLIGETLGATGSVVAELTGAETGSLPASQINWSGSKGVG